MSYFKNCKYGALVKCQTLSEDFKLIFFLSLLFKSFEKQDFYEFCW